METDTPETDSVACDGWDGSHFLVPYEFARKLERERNEAKEGEQSEASWAAQYKAEAMKYITLWDRATKELEALKFGPETSQLETKAPEISDIFKAFVDHELDQIRKTGILPSYVIQP